MKEIQYLGQNGFCVRWESIVIVFDLYLSDCVFEVTGNGVRNYAPPVRASEMTNINYYFISHEHLDHMDPKTIKTVAEVSPETVFICPFPLIYMLENMGVKREKIIGAKAGCPFEISEDIRVIPIPEKHEDYILLDGEHAVLGYVLEKDDTRFYHAGDVIADKELAETLKSCGRMNVMFVPINGHDWKRYSEDIMGNMNYREALDLCAYVGTDLVIPMHYDLFENNTDNPAFFVDYLYRKYPKQKFKMFMPGENIYLE